jgi:DNA-binding response OmpR family regulator
LPSAAAIPSVARAGRRILVTDDLRDTADSMAMFLRALGHDVEAAYDGEEALRIAEEFRPDVVLLDIGMPRLDGYETCRQIRSRAWGKSTVLIAMTGWGQEADRQRALAAGFDHHLVKPADPAAVLELIGALPTVS